MCASLYSHKWFCHVKQMYSAFTLSKTMIKNRNKACAHQEVFPTCRTEDLERRLWRRWGALVEGRVNERLGWLECSGMQRSEFTRGSPVSE